jgi:hypothetical protein
MNGVYYKKILTTLAELKKSHPTYNLGKHLATILDDYQAKDLWGMDDDRLYRIVKKYQDALQLDVPHDDSEIDKIIKDGMKLHDILDEEDEY